MKKITLALLLAASSATAQPAQPPPARSYPLEDTLKTAPMVTLQNSHARMTVAVPDQQNGFFRGTRFDQAGVVTSLVVGGTEFYAPWFRRTAPDVLDYTYTDDGLVAGPDSAASGPVEEFAVMGFDEAKPGDLFLKIGVGLLRRPDNKPYDKYWHYEIADWGQRSVRRTPGSITFIQTLKGAGYAYRYEKTLRLVPGKPQLEISHVLTNLGGKPIQGWVYDHNFHSLAPGNEGVTVKFPFPIAAEKPPAADLIRLEGNSFRYLRPQLFKERVSFVLTGYGKTADDYDIRIDDPRRGASISLRGDHPITRVNIFSLDNVQAVEPYIALDIAPAGAQRWRYLYTYTVKR